MVVNGLLYCELHGAAPPMYDGAAPPHGSQRGLSFVRRIVILRKSANVGFRLAKQAVAIVKRSVQ